MRAGPQSPYGAELLTFAARQLPELQPCLEAVDFGKSTPLPEEQAFSHLQALRSACGCYHCTSTTGKWRRHCLGDLAKTIVEYIRILSITRVHNVLPTPLGLRRLCDDMRFQGADAVNPNVLPMLAARVWQLFSSTASCFVTPEYQDQPLAVSGGGVRCFYKILEDPASEPTQAPIVHVTPGHLTYRGSMFGVIHCFRVHQDRSWLGWQFNPNRRLELYVSELADSRTLEVSFQESHDALQSPCMISVMDILRGCLDHELDTEWQCRPEPILFRFWGEDLDSETIWQTRYVTAEDSGHVDDTSYYQQCWSAASRYSLIVIVTDLEDSTTPFEIYKTSCEYWDQLSFNFEKLYAGYALIPNWGGSASVRVEIARVSDCPRCIVTFVAFYIRARCWDGAPLLAKPNRHHSRSHRRSAPGRSASSHDAVRSLPTICERGAVG